MCVKHPIMCDTKSLALYLSCYRAGMRLDVCFGPCCTLLGLWIFTFLSSPLGLRSPPISHIYRWCPFFCSSSLFLSSKAAGHRICKALCLKFSKSCSLHPAIPHTVLLMIYLSHTPWRFLTAFPRKCFCQGHGFASMKGTEMKYIWSEGGYVLFAYFHRCL